MILYMCMYAMYACMHIYACHNIDIYIHACRRTWMFTYMKTFMVHTCIRAHKYRYICAYTCTHMHVVKKIQYTYIYHAHIHKYKKIYIHTCIHAYMHTYTQTDTHTVIFAIFSGQNLQRWLYCSWYSNLVDLRRRNVQRSLYWIWCMMIWSGWAKPVCVNVCMYVCMYVCMIYTRMYTAHLLHTHVCVLVPMHIHTHVYRCMHVRMYGPMDVSCQPHKDACIYVRMHARTYLCMYVCMFFNSHMHVCMYVCIFTTICTYAFMYIPMYVCMYVLTAICTYACMYIPMYVCMYLNSHMYVCSP